MCHSVCGENVSVHAGVYVHACGYFLLCTCICISVCIHNTCVWELGSLRATQCLLPLTRSRHRHATWLHDAANTTSVGLAQ